MRTKVVLLDTISDVDDKNSFKYKTQSPVESWLNNKLRINSNRNNR